MIKKLTLLFSFIFFTSCRHDNPEALNNIPTICFTQDIKPIFVNNCAMSGCHNSSSKAEGHDFSSYNEIMKSITPNDPENSEAYQAISSPWFIMPPPPHSPLSKENRTLIRTWILQGAKETNC